MPVLNKYFDRVFQNVALESRLVRWQNTLLRKSCAEVSNAMIDLFNETVAEFTDKKAWKMAEVGNEPELRSR